jgi:hypothetical protein
MMTQEQRMQAAGHGRIVWCRAMEVLWLNQQGDFVRAGHTLVRSGVSPRKIGRVMRQLAWRIGEDDE